MDLSKRCEYALRALIHIGLAEELGQPIVRIGTMARNERISEPFLGQILLQLNEGGYLRSRRGKGGGYALARPMAKIRLGDVVRLMDGPLAPIRCASVTAYEKCSCPDEDHCGLRLLMIDVRNAISGILDGYTLADIVQVTLKKMRRDGVRFPLAERPKAARARRARR
jgi:Rrf2 family protein